MSVKMHGKVIITKAFSVKSQRAKFWGIIEFDDIMIELKKPCKTLDETIEKLKRNVELIKVFGFNVKWSDLENEFKKKNKKQNTESKGRTDQDKKTGEIGSPKGKKSPSTTDLPF